MTKIERFNENVVKAYRNNNACEWPAELVFEGNKYFYGTFVDPQQTKAVYYVANYFE